MKVVHKSDEISSTWAKCSRYNFFTSGELITIEVDPFLTMKSNNVIVFSRRLSEIVKISISVSVVILEQSCFLTDRASPS